MNIFEKVGTPFARACENKMYEKIAKGVSKHEERAKKIQSGNMRKSSNLLHSDNTINGYCGVITRYAQWMAEKHPECRRLIVAHKRHYDREYIQEQIDAGKKPATIKNYTAALAFLHKCPMNKIHNCRPVVKTQQATRSRGYSPEKYQNQLAYRQQQEQTRVADIMEICRMTGVRRDEAKQLRPSNFVFDGKQVVCHLSGNNNVSNKLGAEATVWTKGGRERTIEILPKYTNKLRNIIARYQANEKICSKIPERIDIHGIRSMYACEMYKACARPIERIPIRERTMENGKDCPSRYRDAQGMIWDRRALLRVSASLGHSRSSVVVENYLWRLRE